MTTGTEGPDNLTNDNSLTQDTVDALGGDDVITVRPPAMSFSGTRRVVVNGGDGFDTLILNIGSTNLNGAGATGFDGSAIIRDDSFNPALVEWTSIERFELTARLFGNVGLGDEVDILHVNPGFATSISTGGGNDEIYFTFSPGQGFFTVHGGVGNDLIDVSGGGGSLAFIQLFGDEGNDTITGTNRADVLNGGDGNDILIGNGVSDTGFGGTRDQFTGGAGNDTITGTAGVRDFLNYALETGTGGILVNLSDSFTILGSTSLAPGEARDTFGDTDTLTDIEDVTGNVGNDQILGNSARNTFYGGAGNDTLIGNGDVDFLIGGAGDDTLRGGAQDGTDGFDDWVLYYEETGGGAVAVNLSASAATVGGVLLASGTARDTFGTIDTLIGIEFVGTGSGNDHVLGSAGGNLIVTGAGNDLLDGGGGSDVLMGGTGDDIYISDGGDNIIENPGEGNDEVRTSAAVFTLTGTNIENLTGTSNSGQELTGADDSNTIRSGSGNDVVHGAGGNDFLYGNAGGDDQLFGDAGNDVLFFGSQMTSADGADGGTGTDQLVLQGGQPLTLGTGVVNIESIAFLSGADQRFGDTLLNAYDYYITTQDVNVAAGVQLLVDGSRLLPGEDLVFNGSAESDGSFFIYGGLGADTLTGGALNDVFIFVQEGQWQSSDTVNGGPGGIDQLALRGNYTVTFGAGQLVGIEAIGLVSAHDVRYGALGSSFSYNLTMSDGNVAAGVQMTVDGAQLRVAETLVFNGSAETDGTFRVFGGQNGDTIVGGAGNDLFQGGLGADSMTGGGGADTFRYLSFGESLAASPDSIADFTPGTDKIDLSRIDASVLSPGDQAFTWIGSNAFTGAGASSAGELRAFDNQGTWVVQGDLNGDGTADLVINLTLQGQTPLGANDFLL